MFQTVVQLTPGAQPLHQALGFEARAVIVTNYTSSYVRLSDVGIDLPPFVYGAVVPLPPGLRWATARLVPTVPAVSGPPVPIAQATLAWTDQQLPSAPGHLLQSSSYGLRQDLGVVTSGANGATASKSFALPAGTTAVGLMMDFTNSGNPASMALVGDQTNQDYTAGNLVLSQNVLLGNFGGGPFIYQIVPTDTSVTISLTSSNPGSACTLRVIAYLDVASVFVQQNRGSFFNVSSAGAAPAAWQGPTTWAYAEAATTVAADLVVPGALQVLRVFAIYLTVDGGTGGFATVEDGTAPTRIVTLSTNSAAAVTAPWGGAGGFALPAGHKITLLPSLTVGASARASVAYSLA